MPYCRDQLTKELHSKKYSVVRLPRTDILPLDLYAIDAAQRPYLGRVQDLWKSDRPQDVIGVTDGGTAALEVSERPTSFPDCSPSFSKTPDNRPSPVNTEYQKAKYIKIVFNEPKVLRANVIQLAKYLTAGDVDWANPVVRGGLLAAPRSSSSPRYCSRPRSPSRRSRTARASSTSTRR